MSCAVHWPGKKGLAVTDTGRLWLHGLVGPVSWTNLAATAYAGSNTLTLKRAVYDGHAGWSSGDHIVIAATDFFDHSEVRFRCREGGCMGKACFPHVPSNWRRTDAQ